MVRVHEGPPTQFYQGVSQFQLPDTPARRGVLTPHTLPSAVEAFLLSRKVGGCTARTVQLYREVLYPFAGEIGPEPGACTPLAVQKYLTDLRARVNDDDDAPALQQAACVLFLVRGGGYLTPFYFRLARGFPLRRSGGPEFESRGTWYDFLVGPCGCWTAPL